MYYIALLLTVAKNRVCAPVAHKNIKKTCRIKIAELDQNLWIENQTYITDKIYNIKNKELQIPLFNYILKLSIILGTIVYKQNLKIESRNESVMSRCLSFEGCWSISSIKNNREGIADGTGLTQPETSWRSGGVTS